MNAEAHGTSAFGAFLTSRQAQRTPAGVGLPDYGELRRVPGLRRPDGEPRCFIGPGALDGEQLTGWVAGALDFLDALPPNEKDGPGRARRSTARP